MNYCFSEDKHEWDLSGYIVDKMCVGVNLGVLVWSHQGELWIQFGGDFVLKTKDEEIKLDPGHGNTLAPVLVIARQEAKSLTAFRNGRMCLKMADDTELIIEGDWQYETWETRGTGELDGASMLCLPLCYESAPWGSD